MAKKNTGLASLDTFSQPQKPTEPVGGYNPNEARTHESNKPYVKHSSIYLQKAIHKKVMHEVRENEITLSDLVEELLVEWLKKHT